jgi:hypothetical protein
MIKKILFLMMLSPALGRAQFPTVDSVYTQVETVTEGFNQMLMLQDTILAVGAGFIPVGQGYQLNKIIRKIGLNGEIFESIYVPDTVGFYPPDIFMRTLDSGYLCNTSTSSQQQFLDNYLFKYDSLFNHQWTWYANPYLTDSTYIDVVQLIGHIVAVGIYAWNDVIGPTTQQDTTGVAIAELNEVGQVVYAKTIYKSSQSRWVQDAVMLDNGSFILSGQSNTGQSGGGTIWILKVSSEGELLNTHVWPIGNFGVDPKLILKDDYVYMTYAFSDESVDWVGDTLDIELYLSKFNYTTWQEEENTALPIAGMAGEQRRAFIVDLILNTNDEIVILSHVTDDDYTDNNPDNDSRVILFTAVDLAGNVIWEKVLEWPDITILNDAIVWDLMLLPNEGYAIHGEITGLTDEYAKRHWFIITDPCGDIVYNGCIVNLDEVFSIQPDIRLYPNPASAQLSISFTNNLKEYSIAVYDMQGKLILSDRVKAYQDVKTLNVANFERGIYAVQLVEQNSALNPPTVKTMRWVKD